MRRRRERERRKDEGRGRGKEKERDIGRETQRERWWEREEKGREEGGERTYNITLV